MRILVSGGAGFIGSHLVDRLLAAEHQVDVVDDLSRGSLGNLADARRSANRRLSFHQIDVGDPAFSDLMARSRPEVVYHLASLPPVAEARRALAVTVLGTLEVLEGARRAGTSKVVFASDGTHIYGEVEPSELPVGEGVPQKPLSVHGAAKRAAAELLGTYREAHNLEFTALALAHVYGPRQLPGPGAVVACFAERLAASQPCTIYGDGSDARDFVYIDDAVDALVRAGERGGGLLLNVGTGRATSVAELHRVLSELMTGDSDIPPVALAAPAGSVRVRRVALDPARASIHLGWSPWTPLEEGLASVADWWRDRPST